MQNLSSKDSLGFVAFCTRALLKNTKKGDDDVIASNKNQFLKDVKS